MVLLADRDSGDGGCRRVAADPCCPGSAGPVMERFVVATIVVTGILMIIVLYLVMP